MSKCALVTGVSGQTGSYLAELLLEHGYDVHGIVRRVAIDQPDQRLGRIKHLLGHERLHLVPGDLTSYASVFAAVDAVRPDECYHLGAQSFVAESFADPHTTMLTNVQGTLHVLEALRQITPASRLYFAATSEMFGQVTETPQHEHTRFHPRSPYGVSKVAGYELVRNYREAYSMHASSGIAFNHESCRRSTEFVTRKITRAVAEIVAGKRETLRLGNLDAKRDWGHARDTARAVHLMLQQSAPDDYVIATGVTRTVAEFCERAFACVGLDWKDHVEVDPKFFRPAEVQVLCGDASKARAQLGWQPEVTFAELVREMVTADCGALGVGDRVLP